MQVGCDHPSGASEFARWLKRVSAKCKSGVFSLENLGWPPGGRDSACAVYDIVRQRSWTLIACHGRRVAGACDQGRGARTLAVMPVKMRLNYIMRVAGNGLLATEQQNNRRYYCYSISIKTLYRDNNEKFCCSVAPPVTPRNMTP